MLEGERKADPIIAAGLGGPETVAARHAYYDRLAADLAQRSAAYKEARRHIETLYEGFDELCEVLNEAETAVVAAPLVTFVDAARKLAVFEERFEESPMDGNSRVVLEVLAWLRRLAADA